MSWLLQLLGWCCGTNPRKGQKEQLTPAGNPLPSTVHKVLCPSDLGRGRLIIVGDVHGCYDQLVELLQKVQYKPRHDNLILVGDLVNKGPKSQQVLSAVHAWCEGSYCWVVRGNHDDAALAAHDYLAQGGSVNDLAPKVGWVQELLPKDVKFLAELPFSIHVQGYNVLVVHAALLPGVPVESQDLGVLTKVRDLIQTPDGRWMGLEQPEEGSRAWAGCWQGPCHVFFGHDAKRNLQEEPFATGLDTGCVYGRQLTACVLPPLAGLKLERDAVGRAEGNHGNQNVRAGSVPQECAAGQGTGEGWQAEGQVAPVPSLQELRGELHSVLSTFVFDKKAEKKQKKLLKKQLKAKH